MFRSCNTFCTTAPTTDSLDLEYVYGCDYCSEEYASETETDVHRRVTHRSELRSLICNSTTTTCKTCCVEIADEEELIKHIKTFHLLSSEYCNQIEKDIFVCDYCHQIFFNKDCLAAHITFIHLTGPLKFKTPISCPKCNRNIKRTTIWSHFLKHEMMSLSCCPICLNKFKNRKEMLLHTKNHPNKYICSTCGYETHKETHFDQHVEKHEKLIANSEVSITQDVFLKYFIPQFPPSMKYVNPNFIKGYFLQDHYKICILCKQLCVDNHQMYNHIKYDHRPETAVQKKSYICNCGQVFSNKILLKHHVFIHKGDHKEVEESSEAQDSNVFYYVIIEPNADGSE